MQIAQRKSSQAEACGYQTAKSLSPFNPPLHKCGEGETGGEVLEKLFHLKMEDSGK